MEQITKKQFVKGTIWKILERYSARGISLVISIVLARLLLPEDYGLIALTTVFTNFSDILIDGGFGTALIRKDKVTEEDYGSVFSVSMIVASFLYILLFISAPLVGDYYSKEELVLILRVIGLVFFIQAFSSTRNAMINRNMKFKELFYCNLVSSVTSGILGIICALTGLGVWALVVQRLSQQLILTVSLLFTIKWKVSFRINLENVWNLFKFGIGVIGASFINYLSSSINNLIVGKKYSVSDLGYVDKGVLLPEQISLNTFGAMSSVLLPTISSYQNDLKKMKTIIRKVVSMTAFLILPLMLGLYAVADDLIVVLFSDKWLSASGILKAFCLYYIATPFMLIDIQIFFALGKSGIRVVTEIIRFVILMLFIYLVCFVVKGSIYWLVYSNALVAFISAFITLIVARKLIDYSISERLLDVIKPFVSSVIMFLLILLLNTFIGTWNMYLRLGVDVLVGGVIYIGLSYIFKTSSLNEVIGLFKKK